MGINVIYGNREESLILRYFFFAWILQFLWMFLETVPEVINSELKFKFQIF